MNPTVSAAIEAEAWNAMSFACANAGPDSAERALYFDGLRAMGAAIAREIAGAPGACPLPDATALDILRGLESVRTDLTLAAAQPARRSAATFEIDLARLRSLERRARMSRERSGLYFDYHFVEAAKLSAYTRSRVSRDFQRAAGGAAVQERPGSHESREQVEVAMGADVSAALVVVASGVVAHLKQVARDLCASKDIMEQATAIATEAKVAHAYEIIERGRIGELTLEGTASELAYLLT